MLIRLNIIGDYKNQTPIKSKFAHTGWFNVLITEYSQNNYNLIFNTMKAKGIILNVLLTFVITFIAAIIVTLLWNLFIEKNGAIVDWKTSFTLAIIIGLVIPIVQKKNK